jgi:hypothetical protein
MGRSWQPALRCTDFFIATRRPTGLTKLIEAKLSHLVAPRYIRAEGEEIPAIESGGKLYFFDQSTVTAFEPRSGAVKWRVQTIGTSQIVADANKKLYVISTTAGPEQINPSRDYQAPVHHRVYRLNPKNGKHYWE